MHTEPTQRPPFLTRLTSLVLARYIRFVYLSKRWQIEGFDELKEKLEKKEPVILAFWHARSSMMPNFAPHPEQVYTIISRHRHGDMMAGLLRHFGLQVIRGSSNRAKTANKGAKNRGGSQALRDSITTLEKGYTLCLSPDGPKGPRMRVSSHVVNIAALTGVPIYPIAFSTGNSWAVNTWDRYLFPFPFGRAVFVCGKPLKLSKNAPDAEVKKGRKTLENRLNQITALADTKAGRVPIEPAPLV